MRDQELESLKRKRLSELKKRFNFQESASIKKNIKSKRNPQATLNKAFKDRAWEVFNFAKVQFPQAMPRITNTLTHLISSGKITSLNGEELHRFLQKCGLRVKLNTTIKFAEKGQLRPLREKLTESS